jgi:hypothetical protein
VARSVNRAESPIVEQQVINIARDFSRYPAGRYRTDGPYPGEKCREDFLVPVLRKGKMLVVELDGTMGYGSSFLEETFGGLVRADGFTPEELRNKVLLVTKDKALCEEIWEYVQEAQQEAQQK